MSSIPLVDLAAQHAEVADEVAAGFERILARTAFVGGAEVADFEAEYAQFGGVAHCVGVANGTDAVELALRAVGVGPGDEVIVPANTFIATAEAVARAGATSVFVDCDPDTYLIDADAALAAVGPKTKAVIPVHLYGQMAEAERLASALAGSGVYVVEDAAQCQGASRLGRTPGSGPNAIAATSFYPGKNLGAYGDAGAVLTDDAELADRVRLISNHGGRTKYVHEVIGFNSRLDALQAVVLRVKLRRLKAWNAARQAAADYYTMQLGGLSGMVLPATLSGNEHVWHLYAVQVVAGSAVRDAVLAELNAQGIGAGVHYPVPVHRTPAFATQSAEEGCFPHAERIAQNLLSLPLHPHLTRDQQNVVVAALTRALA